jgi:hypothetical protein
MNNGNNNNMQLNQEDLFSDILIRTIGNDHESNTNYEANYNN